MRSANSRAREPVLEGGGTRHSAGLQLSPSTQGAKQTTGSGECDCSHRAPLSSSRSGEQPVSVNLLPLVRELPTPLHIRPGHSRKLSLCLFLGSTAIIHGCITDIRTQELHCYKT